VIGAPTLDILSAGAAKAVVLALGAGVRARERMELAGVFDAAGAVRARFAAGDPCDVLILPAPMQDELEADRRVDAAQPLGRVPTGIAVATGAPAPDVHDADALRASLENATALFCPDTERSTAGIHFVRMLREMGIHARVAARIRNYPNGAQAMAALAAMTSGRDGAIGCTQVTEILYTPRVTLVAPLPAPFELSTTYSAAASLGSRHPDAARRFVAELTGCASLELRAASGFAQAKAP
jgi:molybdate transport system substrate-binding protein